MKKKIVILCVLIFCVLGLSIGIYFQLNDQNGKQKDNIGNIQKESISEKDYGESVAETKDGDLEESSISNPVPDSNEESASWNSYGKVRNSIVKIDMGELSGSGVVLEITDTQFVIVSCAHLLETYESGVVTFSNGAVTVGWVKAVSEKYDAGIMVVDLEDVEKEKRDYIKAVSYDEAVFDQVKEKDTIFQVGSSSGVAADFYIGTLSAKEWFFEEFDEYMLYNFCKATPGMSGGGCFTEDGYLIGLVSGSYMEESCALPLPAILEVYEELMP